MSGAAIVVDTRSRRVRANGTVASHISRVRRKLVAAGLGGDVLEAVWGVGHRLTCTAEVVGP